MKTGELHASFAFATERLAKIGWERVAKRCRLISVNRWPLDPADLHGRQAVTVLAEEEERATFERACFLLANGKRFDASDEAITAMRLKRARVLAAGGGRRFVRAPLGHWLSWDGIDTGPTRRPQG